MQQIITDNLINLLSQQILNLFGISHPSNLLYLCVNTILLIIVVTIIYRILDKYIAVLITKVVKKTDNKVDDYLCNPKILSTLSLLVSVYLLYRWSSASLIYYPSATKGVDMICQIAIVSLVVRAVILAIKAMYAMLDNHEEASQTARSLKGVVQLCQTIVICIGAIIIISIIIGRSPLFILSGLGASAAILLLVFKETILGFMASIRLNSNNMLQVGDWITMSSRNINGIVKEICLTTVKIENYDMTIVTVPPYALVSESFQNWRGMQDKGARRIMRSLNIDISSVRHCTSEEIIRFAKEPWGKNLKPNGKYVNLSLYRQALKYRVEHEPTFRENADEKMYCMVRELQPTPYGIPVQIYLFTSETAWPDYEEVQASLMDNIIVLTSDFGLKVFQVERL